MDRWISTSAASLAAISGVGGLAKLLSFKWAGGIAIASALIGATAATIAARQTTEEAVNRADFPGGQMISKATHSSGCNCPARRGKNS